MYKLICIDLDGTLLDTRQRVSAKNKDAIRKALDKGIEVAIVSGRPNCFTIRIMNQISGRMGHITFNGAYYRVANKTKQFPIDPDTVKKIAKLAKKYNVRVFFKNKNLSMCTKSDPGILDYDQFKAQTPLKDQMDMLYNIDVDQILEEQDIDILKIFAWDTDLDAVRKMREELLDMEGINLYLYDEYFEMSSDQTSKGKAILNVCKDLGIKPEEVVCIGDNYNDLPMFEIAGLSVAMENAPKEIKAKVDKVTLTNDQSGVAYAIENFVLKENE